MLSLSKRHVNMVGETPTIRKQILRQAQDDKSINETNNFMIKSYLLLPLNLLIFIRYEGI
jgi:hypothetical protein